MAIFRLFTRQQALILTQLGDLHPERWRLEADTMLGSLRTEAEFRELEQDLIIKQRGLREWRSTLPTLDQLPEYLCDIGWPARPHIVARVDDDGPRGLHLPGNDIDAAIRSRYATLHQLLDVAAELIAETRSCIARLQPAPRLPSVVMQAIAAIPMTSGSDQLSIETTLRARQGRITLSKHTKKDTAVILRHLHRLLESTLGPLTAVERKQIEIECVDQAFPWFGPGPRGGKSRDHVSHIDAQETIKPSPLIQAWIDAHPQ
jgi:hypothetical protein